MCLIKRFIYLYHFFINDLEANKILKCFYSYRDILLWYEIQLTKLKLPEGLAWDMWGSLFYVGTLFTTIGKRFFQFKSNAILLCIILKTQDFSSLRNLFALY